MFKNRNIPLYLWVASLVGVQLYACKKFMSLNRKEEKFERKEEEPRQLQIATSLDAPFFIVADINGKVFLDNSKINNHLLKLKVGDKIPILVCDHYNVETVATCRISDIKWKKHQEEAWSQQYESGYVDFGITHVTSNDVLIPNTRILDNSNGYCITASVKNALEDKSTFEIQFSKTTETIGNSSYSKMFYDSHVIKCVISLDTCSMKNGNGKTRFVKQ